MASLTPDELETRTLHAQDGLLVLDKPHGLPTSGHSLSDPDCLQTQLTEHHSAMIWAVHQLDADTTGLNLFVSEQHLVHETKERMAWPRCEKSYLAVLHGAPRYDHVHVDAPVEKLQGSARGDLGVSPTGRSASSRFEILARGPAHCLPRVRIETGRTHQVRIHAAHIGHPLVGEEWYRARPCTQHPRQALHAHRLRFRDGEAPEEFEARVPDDLRLLCQRLGITTQGIASFDR